MKYSYWRKKVLALCVEVEEEGKVVKKKIRGRKERVEEVVSGFGVCMAKFHRTKSGVKRVEGYIEKMGELRDQMDEDVESWAEMHVGLGGYIIRMKTGDVEDSDFVGYSKIAERYRSTVEGVEKVKTEFYVLDGYIKGALDFARAWFKEHMELEELVKELEDVRRERKGLEGVRGDLGRTDREVA